MLVEEGCCAVTSDWDLFSTVLADSWLETDTDTGSLKMPLSSIFASKSSWICSKLPQPFKLIVLHAIQ